MKIFLPTGEFGEFPLGLIIADAETRVRYVNEYFPQREEQIEC